MNYIIEVLLLLSMSILTPLQILHLEEELASIERLVRRVEVANEKGQNYGSSGITITPASDLHPHQSSRPYGGHSAFGFAEAVNTPRADLMVDLIQQYTDLMSNIDRAASKQINVQVDFPTDDFPKEISDRLEILSRCDKYAHALSVKDHMLWLALKDKEKCEEALEQETTLCKEYASEISHWAESAQAMKNKLYDAQSEIDNLRRENEQLKQMLGQQHVYFS
jgi:FtsZ-binding cell division protein ZapB